LINERDLKESRPAEFAVLNILPYIPSPAIFAERLFDVVAFVISFFTKCSNGVFAQYKAKNFRGHLITILIIYCAMMCKL